MIFFLLNNFHRFVFCLDIIVKENEKEVERFPITELIDIQAKTLHCKEVIFKVDFRI